MTRKSALGLGRFLLAACLWILVAGCAGARRTFSYLADPGTKPKFELASHAAAKPMKIGPLTSFDFIEDEPARTDEAFDLPPAVVSEPELVAPPVTRSALPRDANSAPSAFRDLSESEMLSLALSHSPVLRPLGLRVLENPQGATTVFDSAIAASDPFLGPQAALAEFDSKLSASINSQNNDRVFNNAIVGGSVQQLVQDLATLSAQWQRRTHSGAIWELNGINGYDNNNRIGNSFPNYWETQLEASVRQPLLQGAGRQFNLIAGPNARPGFNFSNGIVIARLNNQISDAEFAIQLRNFVADLYTAYWDLDRQYRDYQNVLQAQELAYRTWQSVLAKREARLAGGEADKEAQARAKYYSYRRQVQATLGGRDGLYVAQRRLRNLIGLPIVDGELLRPIDRCVAARYVFDYDVLISRAMAGRTELTRQSLRLRQQQLRVIAAKNFLLPQMDLIGRYRLRGLGDDLTGSGPRFSSAYQDFFSFDHQEWEFGLEMGVVAGRRQARAAVRNAALQLNREKVILAEQQRRVRHEISDAYAEVASSYMSMETSQAQVDASRQRLDASESLFAADKIQIEFLLDAQEDLVRAQLQLTIDQARYTVSLVSVNAAVGSLLEDVGIHVQFTNCQSNMIYRTAESVTELPAEI